MTAPVNVKLQEPTIPVRDWADQAAQWVALNHDLGGNDEFYPLTVKAAYVIGVIHDLCECVSLLLSPKAKVNVTYLPAYGVFASGVELLGRCINGNMTDTGSSTDLERGFRWIIPSIRSISDVVISTSARSI